MAKKPKRGRGRSLPVLRHHLEDHQDRTNESGPPIERRELRYASRALRHFDLVLRGELADPLFEELELVDVTPDVARARLVLRFRPCSPRTRDEIELIERRLESARGLLRASLAANVPRRRVPDLAFTVTAYDEDEGGEA